MSRVAGRSVHPLALVVVSLLLATSLAPLGAGQQAPDSCEPRCLEIVSLSMEDSPVVAQGDNKITGYIVNKGDTPMQARAYIKAEAPGVSFNSSRTLYTIQGNHQEEVPMDWTGPDLDAGVDQVTFTLVAWAEAGGQPIDGSHETLSITRAVQYNDFSLDIASPPSGGIDRGETKVIAQVDLTNTGNVVDTAMLSVLSVQGDSDWEFTVVTPDDVADQLPGEEHVRTLFIEATAPGDPNAEGSTADFKLEVQTSELRAQNPDRGLSRLRDTLEMTTPVVTDGDNLRVTITSPSEALAVVPGNDVTYTVEVYNPTEDPRSAEVVFDAATAPDDNVTLPLAPETAVIDPGEAHRFDRTATVDAGAFAGSHAWWVNTTDTTQTIGGYENQQTLDLQVKQIHEVAFTMAAPVDGTRDVAPGDEAAEMLFLSNLGNGEVEICVEADLPDGWTPVAECADVGRDRANGGGSRWNETQPLLWSVQTPTSTPAGEYEIPLHVTDGVDDSESQTITFNILEQTHPAIYRPLGDPKPIHWLEDLDLDPEDGPTLPVIGAPCVFGVEPGRSRTVDIGLGNEGNADGDFSFTLDVADEQGFWSLTEPEEEHTLAKGETKTVSFDVEAPELATPEDFVEITLLLQEVDENGDAVPGRSSDPATCVLGAAYPDLTVLPATPAQTPDDLYTDHPSVLHFRVINTGLAGTGGPVQVRSVIETPDGEEIVQAHEVEALDAYPGTWWRDLAVHFNATQADDHTYTIEVDPDHLIEEPEEAEGSGAPGAAPNTLTDTLDVRDFGIEVDAPTGRIAIPEQTVTFEDVTDSAFIVRNTGDDMDDTHTLTLNLTMQPAWKSFEDETITLDPGEEHVVNMTFKVPEFPQAHEATVTLRVSNATLPSLAHEDAVRIRIDDDAGPQITAVSSSVNHVLVGDSVEFSAHIVDAAGVADARLYLVAPDGTVSQHTMGGGPLFNVSADFDQIGNHTAHVWARDAAVSNNTADTSDAPMQIEVLPDDRPHVRLVTPEDGSYLRPGVPVVLTVLSKQPVVHAQYSLGSDDVSVQPSNPLHLATDDWPEGPAQLHVEVRDALGVEAAGSYAFHIDGTPPEVVDFTIDALSGTSRVEAVLEDESGIAAAEVRISRADGRTDTVALEEDGAFWVAEVELPADVASVTVVATDLAGNRGIAEKTLQGVQSGDKGAPGLALPLLVAALAGILLARRRDSA